MFCPLCNNTLANISLTYLSAELRICDLCGSFVSTTKLDNVLEKQIVRHENCWREESIDSLEKEVENLRELARFIVSKTPGRDKKIMEIGFGRGTLIAALNEIGINAYGIEPSKLLYDMAFKTFSLKSDRVFNIDVENFLNINNKYFDSIILWHVMEHLEDPLQIIEKLSKIITKNGTLIFQTPLPINKHIIPEHLFFPTIKSYNFIAEHSHMFISEFSFDIENAFLTVILTKSKKRESNNELYADPTWYQYINAATDYVRYVKEQKIILLEQNTENLEKEIKQIKTKLKDYTNALSLVTQEHKKFKDSIEQALIYKIVSKLKWIKKRLAG